jgi:alpha-L-rhamnosidase
MWQGRWIWAAEPERSVSRGRGFGGPPPETWNRFCYLRRSFELAEKPISGGVDHESAIMARMTADSRFVLYVNGTEVARGPARSVPERLSYIEVDLSPYLRSGENVVGALVRFYGRPNPWWIPAAPSHQLGYGSFAFEAPAIGIVTDASWRGRPAPYQQQVDATGSVMGMAAPPTEVIDGAGVPVGWASPGFHDSGWLPAVVLSGGPSAAARGSLPAVPYSAVEPAGIALLTASGVDLAPLGSRIVTHVETEEPLNAYPRPDDVAAADTGDVLTVYDAGGMTIATPALRMLGMAGAIVDVYAGETLRADGLVEIRPRDYALRYRLAGIGDEVVEGFEAVGFRYLCVAVRGDAQVAEVRAIERRHPRDDVAAFACNDEQLNQIWAAGARTLDVCATDAFLDCPGREQRSWVGDAYIHALLTYVTNSDWRLIRRHLRIAAHGQRRDGLLAMAAACDLTLLATTIPDYSLHWLRTLARYLEHTGDVETVRELLPTAAAIVGAFERYRQDDGLLHHVPGWVFVDWAMTERAEVTGAVDALYAAALDDYARLLDFVGAAAGEAERVRALAARTRAAFELLWDEARGVYVDAAGAAGPRRRVSQQTNAMAIIGSCAPPERWARMLAFVLDPGRPVVTPVERMMRTGQSGQLIDPATVVAFDPETNVVAAQPFFSHFLHQAVVLAGRRDLIPELCRRWWPQIASGNTTIGELWDGPADIVSRAHAWSCTPTYDLSTHVLGVRPLAPGYTRAELRPHFGPLERLSGRVPTPLGPIEIDLTRDGGAITIPVGITASLSFDDVPLQGGELPAGRHAVTARSSPD